MATAIKKQRKKVQLPEIFPVRTSDSIPLSVKAKRPQKQQNKVVGELYCSICFNVKNYSQYKSISCCHLFHARCINAWLKSSKKCPICKTEITNTSKKPSDLHTISNAISANTEISFFDSSSPEFPDSENYASVAPKKQRKKLQPSAILHRKRENDCLPSSVEREGLQKQQHKAAKEIHCSICMNSKNYSQHKTVSCCHVFHSRCINKWLKYSNTCPICETEITNTSKKTSNACTSSKSINFNAEISDSDSYTQQAIKKRCTKVQSHEILKRKSDRVQPAIEAEKPQKQQIEVAEMYCSICLNTENYSQHKAVRCCHVFHTRCINKWLKSSNFCPVCKTEISNNSTRSPDVYVDSNGNNFNTEYSDFSSSYSEFSDSGSLRSESCSSDSSDYDFFGFRSSDF